LLVAISGFAQDVRYNFAPGQDFSRFKTFRWAQIKNADQLNALIAGGDKIRAGERMVWGGGFTTTTTETIQIGQIDLDMDDAAQETLIWRGTVSKSLDTKAMPENGRRTSRCHGEAAETLSTSRKEEILNLACGPASPDQEKPSFRLYSNHYFT